MDYEEFVSESIEFFENAQKRTNGKLEQVQRESDKLQLEKELEAFVKLKGYWDQEKLRMNMAKKYSKK
jgi:hypothetical protein